MLTNLIAWLEPRKTSKSRDGRETCKWERAPTTVVVPGFESDSSVHLVGKGERWCIVRQLILDSVAIVSFCCQWIQYCGSFSCFAIRFSLMRVRTTETIAILPNTTLSSKTNAALQFENLLIDHRKSQDKDQRLIVAIHYGLASLCTYRAAPRSTVIAV